MFQWSLLMAVRRAPCSVSGSLDGSAATATVTGTSQTVEVKAPNTGRLEVRNLAIGSGTPQASIAGGAFAAFVDLDIFTLTNGQSLQIRGSLMTASTSITFDLFDKDTNALIASVTIART